MAYQKIYKYPVSIGTFIHAMPKGAEVLCVQMQEHNPQMWVLVNPKAEAERREFIVVGTGHSYTTLSGSRYIGTFQDSSFVWHLFEIV